MAYSCFPSRILDSTYVFSVFATDVTFGQLFPLFLWFFWERPKDLSRGLAETFVYTASILNVTIFLEKKFDGRYIVVVKFCSCYIAWRFCLAKLAQHFPLICLLDYKCVVHLPSTFSGYTA